MKPKRLVRSALDKIGLVIHRKIQHSRSTEVFEDPIHALHHHNIDVSPRCPSVPSVTFRCPVNEIVSSNGFNHSVNGWHPFSATLIEYKFNRSLTYESSVLKEYYDKWQPSTAREAIAGWPKNDSILASLPSYVILPPWNPNTVEQEEKAVRSWTRKDNIEHGGEHLDFESGCNYHGPVTIDKGKLEFRRLIRIFDSIERNGYDRRHGDVTVNILKRRENYRYIAVGGHHRIATMRAVRKSYVPATCRFNWIIDIDHAGSWPQVRRGKWTEKHAKAYFNHLFDFNARSWARNRGLL